MRYRYTPLTFCCVALGMALIACGADDSGSNDTNSTDSGSPSSTIGSTITSGSSGVTDTGSDTANSAATGMASSSMSTSTSTGAGGMAATTEGATGTTGDPNQPPFDSDLLCGENHGLEWSRLVGVLEGEDFV